MTKYKIVLVPFPFDDFSGTKVRPAVCLTEPIGPFRHIVLAFVTSKLPDNLLETDIVISPGDKGFENTGLRVLSTLRLHRMMTTTTSIIRRELGLLSDIQQETVKYKLKRLFKLE